MGSPMAFFIDVDPYIAGLSDDVIRGETDESMFRNIGVWMFIGRFAEKIMARFLLFPSAFVIAAVVKCI